MSSRIETLRAKLFAPIPPRWAHQEETYQFGQRTPIMYDTSDPGTGKTRGHLDIFAERLAKGETEKALIVCPKSLVVPAWGNDITKFQPDLQYSAAFAENREAAFAQDAPIYITNTDAVTFLAKKTPTWIKKHFGSNPTLIVDESTSFKHRTSARSKALKKVAKHFEFRELLTGTPFTSTVMHMWHQIMVLDRGKRLGTAYTRMRNEIQHPVQQGPFVKWEDNDDAEELVAYLIKDISIRHDFDEVMDIPENYSRTVEFDMGKKGMKAYQEMEDTAFLELMEGNVSAVNAAVLNNKLLQIASGAVYGEGPNGREAHLIDNNRYELVTDLVEERSHSVVFFSWGHQRDSLSNHANKRKISHAIIDGRVPNAERTKIVKQFQAGDLQALYLHPQTGVHGLTLTRGIATIWASPRYEPDFVKQGKHRIYRGGQKNKTENIMVSANNTIEPLIYERMNARMNKMVSMLDLLNERRGQ